MFVNGARMRNRSIFGVGILTFSVASSTRAPFSANRLRALPLRTSSATSANISSGRLMHGGDLVIVGEIEIVHARIGPSSSTPDLTGSPAPYTIGLRSEQRSPTDGTLAAVDSSISWHLSDTRAADRVITDLRRFIDRVYNTRGFHSALGYSSPARLEDRHARHRVNSEA